MFPLSSKKRSASVYLLSCKRQKSYKPKQQGPTDFPWSICATMLKFRMVSGSKEDKFCVKYWPIVPGFTSFKAFASAPAFLWQHWCNRWCKGLMHICDASGRLQSLSMTRCVDWLAYVEMRPTPIIFAYCSVRMHRVPSSINPLREACSSPAIRRDINV